MSGSTIKKCICKHKYQDAKYGKNNRVHNIGELAYICTVCNSEKKIAFNTNKGTE